MIGAGDLDHRVQVLRETLTDDGMSSVGGWDNHGSPIWAGRKDISDGERWQAGAMHAHVTTRFMLRWSLFAAGITPKDRLLCGVVEYEIVGIKVIGRRQWVEITASMRPDL